MLCNHTPYSNPNPNLPILTLLYLSLTLSYPYLTLPHPPTHPSPLAPQWFCCRHRRRENGSLRRGRPAGPLPRLAVLPVSAPETPSLRPCDR